MQELDRSLESLSSSDGHVLTEMASELHRAARELRLAEARAAHLETDLQEHHAQQVELETQKLRLEAELNSKAYQKAKHLKIYIYKGF